VEGWSLTHYYKFACCAQTKGSLYGRRVHTNKIIRHLVIIMYRLQITRTSVLVACKVFIFLCNDKRIFNQNVDKEKM
jgi:hypothetical protein